MPTFVKTGYWDKLSKAPKGFLNLEELIASSIGSGLPGQVAFWGASGLGGSSNLVWDSVNSKLGIGVSVPSGKLTVYHPTATGITPISAANNSIAYFASNGNSLYHILLDNQFSGTSAAAGIRLANNAGLNVQMYLGSTTHVQSANRFTIEALNTASISLQSRGGDIDLVTGGDNPTFSKLRVFLNGNVGIGTNLTDAGFKLDVVGGDARINTINIGLGGGSIATNTRVGASALNANTTGTSNVAFGNSAMLSNTTGINNVVVGTEAMYTSTTGSNNNVIVGRQAAYYCTAIVDSIAIGAAALSNALNSQRNIAIGRQSMINSVSGNDNTAIGYRALYGSASSTYANNTAIGSNALGNMLSGGNNTAIGYNAGLNAPNFGSNNTTSTNSIYLGYQTSASANGNTNEIVIGYNIAGLGSNTTIIGNSSTITTALRGRLLLGTTIDTGFYQIDVNGSTRLNGYVAIGSGPNGNGDLQIGKALSIGYITATGLQGSLILGGTGTTLNSNSLTISSGGYANTLGNACVSRYILAAAPSSVGANSVTNLLVLDGQTLKLNDGTSAGINSFYNAGIITVDLTVFEVSSSGNSNMYAGKFVFRFKRYLINNVGTFTDISAVTNLYNSADATLVGTTLQAVANGSNALDIRVTLPSTANTAGYRMGANVTITKVNQS